MIQPLTFFLVKNPGTISSEPLLNDNSKGLFFYPVILEDCDEFWPSTALKTF